MLELLPHLLPTENATPLERAASIVDGERLALYAPTPLLSLLDPQTCPAQFLPALAFELSVEEEWHLARTEQQQRDLLSNAYALNAAKGTPFAVKRGLAVIGFPGSTLVEGFPALVHDGFIAKRNGRYSYNSQARWALFDVRLPLSRAQVFDDDERARVLRGIEIWQRAACYLRALHLSTAVTVVRGGDAEAGLRIHIGLNLQARRETPRDGRYQRSGLRYYRYDGVWAHDGIPRRDGAALPMPSDALRYGVQQLDPHLGVHLHLAQDRPPSIQFDAAIRHDGTFKRNHNGAVMRQHRRVGFGGLAAMAERAARHDGSIPYDGSARRGMGVPAVQPVLRTHRHFLHDGTVKRGGPAYDGSAVHDGTLHRGTVPRFTATGRLTASVP